MGLFDNMEVVSSFTPDDNFNKDLPTLVFDNPTLTSSSPYDSFGVVVLGNDTSIDNSLDFDTRVKEANLTQATLSSLTAKEFSKFAEENILPKTKVNRDTNISNLVQPIEDIDFSQSSMSSSSTNLLGVLKDIGKNQNDINSKILDAINHATTLQHNSNEILADQNKILLEKNRILENKYYTDLSHQKIIAESSVLSSQMLGYIPALIEAITIGNKNKIEVENIANSHRYQKNVNDAYAFNYNKDDENGIKSQLGGIVTNLASSAQSHSEIAVEHKKLGDLAVEEKLIIDEENSSDFQDIIKEAYDVAIGFVDSLSDTVSDELSEFNIFNYLLTETTQGTKK